MLSKTDLACVRGVAGACNVDPAALAAVVAVESGGRVTARVAGREEPLIRWEGHYFDRLCRPAIRIKARRSGLASPRAGAIPNPPTQAGRWALLKRAAALDHDAAYASCSWGVGQVMGAHWQALGYADVDALVAEARSGLAGQLRLMVLFIAHAGLTAALAAHDWQAFARRYNGPGYRRSGYDAKLARAFATISEKPATRRTLRIGDRGGAVTALQAELAASGAAIAVDGRYGAATAEAVRTFQKRQGLAADGVAGPLTLAALDAMDRPDGRR
ncbi:MAG: N-acetylmuramidase domain-containing protein [Pararhizobium sp.]